MSTSDKVLKALEAYNLRAEGDGKWRCNSPFRAGADSLSFTILIRDGEHGAYNDWAGDGQQGSLYQLAAELGIEIEGRTAVASSKRGYSGLKDYAESHGLALDILTKLGWHETQHNGRAAIQFPTTTGDRWRFTDGLKPKFTSSDGYKSSWYRLTNAIDLAQKNHWPLILCNGEISTIKAQVDGLPAVALTGGEKHVPSYALEELIQRWDGPILLCFDCDEAGRLASRKWAVALAGLRKVTVVDLRLGVEGDLSDFCRLHGADAMKLLLTEAEAEREAFALLNASANHADKSVTTRSYDDAVESARRRMAIASAEAEPLIMPFGVLHHMGGFCRAIPRGKMIGVVGVSGGGKTSFVTTMNDRWQQSRPIHTLFWGPEWTPEEMVERRIQSLGGPTMTDLALHRTWMSEDLRGVEAALRNGVRLDDASLSLWDRLLTSTANWPGKTIFIEQMNLSIEELMEASRDKVNDLKKAGIPISVMVWDYAQLLATATAGGDPARVPYVLGRLKSFVSDNQLVGVVSSQVTKTASRADKEDIGKPINADDAQYLRTDTMNLVLTLKPLYSDNSLVRSQGIIGIGKNSGGKSNLAEWVYAWPERLMWLDERVPFEARRKKEVA